MLIAPAYQLGRALLETIVWLDLFYYPPTAQECWRWLVHSTATPAEVAHQLDALVAAGWLVQQGEQFCLTSRQENFSQRQQRQKFSERKFHRANLFARAAAWLPFVRMVAVTSKLSYQNASDDSDIDLFIVTTPGTIWTSRLILAGALQLLRLRPAPGRIRDSLCLSFLVDENHLNLERFALPGADPDLRWWAATLRPLYDAGNLAQCYTTANLKWVGEWLPNVFPKDPRKNINPIKINFFQRQIISLARLFEPIARRLQERWFPSVIRDLKNLDTRVVVESGVLKFHVTDRRAEYRAKYQVRLQELGLATASHPANQELKQYVVS